MKKFVLLLLQAVVFIVFVYAFVVLFEYGFGGFVKGFFTEWTYLVEFFMR